VQKLYLVKKRENRRRRSFDAVITFFVNTHLNDFDKIIIAGVLGGIIGIEREHHGQAAGLRTNMIVCLGACLLMQLSLYLEDMHLYLKADSVVRIDPGRIASYAIASMGFLGAGAIIKGNNSIRGLTTAASLWLVTGLGLSVGAGLVYPATLVTILTILILYLFPIIMKKIITRHVFIRIIIVLDNLENSYQEIKDILTETKAFSIMHVDYIRDIANNQETFTIKIVAKKDCCWQSVSENMTVLSNLKKISFEEANVY